ncbi:hypothetical protein KH5H1_55810 [Corallococcus caeni]|nr:hypothetical protein KH5H1_55810 [Corallococcus sp. KH5-1]
MEMPVRLVVSWSVVPSPSKSPETVSGASWVAGTGSTGCSSGAPPQPIASTAAASAVPRIPIHRDIAFIRDVLFMNSPMGLAKNFTSPWENAVRIQVE